MKQFKFEMKSSSENIEVNFSYINIDHLMIKIIGFLRAVSMTDTEIKDNFNKVISGNWTSDLSTLLTQNITFDPNGILSPSTNVGVPNSFIYGLSNYYPTTTTTKV